MTALQGRRPRKSRRPPRGRPIHRRQIQHLRRRHPPPFIIRWKGSIDVRPALLGKADAKGRSSLIEQDNGNAGNFGFRKGNWKLQRHNSKKAFNRKVSKKLANNQVPEFQLFDLSKDPAEKHNVIAQHPKITTRLQEELAALIAAGRSRN